MENSKPIKAWDTGTGGGVAPYWTVSASGLLIVQISWTFLVVGTMHFVCFLESEKLFAGLINHVSGKKKGCPSIVL